MLKKKNQVFMPLFPHGHCGFCGTAFPDPRAPFPRTCSSCSQTTYDNPKPVGVVLLPVGGEGVLLIQRNVADGKGKWALPGGFLETGESWQAGTARELAEETGIRISPQDLHLYDLKSTPDGAFLLIFCIGPHISRADLPKAFRDEEIMAMEVSGEIRELAFPLHTEVLKRYLETRLD